MSTFRDWTADRQPIDTFRSRVPGHYPQTKKSGDDHTLPLHIFEWAPGYKHGIESSGTKSIAELEVQNHAIIRIV
jgi:hypothetical protein